MGQRPVGPLQGEKAEPSAVKRWSDRQTPVAPASSSNVNVGGKLPREMQIAAVLLMLSTNTWLTATRRGGMARWRGGDGPRQCHLPVYQVTFSALTKRSISRHRVWSVR